MKKVLLSAGLLLLLTGCATANGSTHDDAKAANSSMTNTSISSTAVSSTNTSSTVETTTVTTNDTNDAAASSVRSETTESSQVTTETSSESSEYVQTLWDANKSAQLAEFMASWGKEMDQQYKSYSNQTSVDLYGLPLPQAILNGEWTAAIGEMPVSMEWSEDGTGQADFEIVAVYSDAETEPYLKKHVYLFGFQQGQPKVLITQQNQGNANNYIYFNETANSELKAGFNRIVNG